MTGRASGTVLAVNATNAANAPRSVDLAALGGVYRGVRYPVWYTPRVGDLVVVDWLGSQPFILTAFA